MSPLSLFPNNNVVIDFYNIWGENLKRILLFGSNGIKIEHLKRHIFCDKCSTQLTFELIVFHMSLKIAAMKECCLGESFFIFFFV